MKKLSLFLVVTIMSQMITAQEIVDISKQNWKLWLDETAEYWDDELFLPPVNISELPVNEPTCGWDALYDGRGKDITVPATVEEHFWGDNGNRFGVAGDYAGVSWFVTELDIPASWEGKRIVLNFESARLRAEVFVNNQLVGYELMNGTPFTLDISDVAKTGEKNNLAVRITDPDGNFLWIDFIAFQWGKYKIPPSHAFGGITGLVKLEATDKTYIEDVYIKNTPEITTVDVDVTIENTTSANISGEVSFEVTPWKSSEVLYSAKAALQEGQNVVAQKIELPKAKAWSPDDPNLYILKTSWKGQDGSNYTSTKRFGFRWFEPKTIDGERMFFLNNKRIVLRSSISWGFWPVNGIYPTEEWGRRQIQVAKDLGLNMLNFHRGIGQTMILEFADEMGLLYYEEPGGYKTGKFGEFTQDWNRERMLRMIKRDRSHPSLIIYNMINESNQDPLPHEYDDIKIFHEADPSRVITFTSTNLFRKGSYKGVNPAYVEAGIKLHMLPYDTTRHLKGWWDQHFPDGPGVYKDEFYTNPTKMHKGSDNKEETVMWGEDGAIGTPHRLELVKNEIDANNYKGWDSDSYVAQFEAYDKFLDEKGFRGAFANVDELCLSLGANAMYYQGRIIENTRINNNVDCYIVNGWEGEKVENHSGVVDIYRNPKGDPAIMAHYNQPLFVSIKARELVFETGKSTLADIFIVNEKDLKGNHKLVVKASDASGEFFNETYKVNLKGGNVYGQLLVEGIEIKPTTTGYAEITAEILKTEATGVEKIFTTKIDSDVSFDKIAVLDSTGKVEEMLAKIGVDNIVESKKGETKDANVLIIHQASQQFSRGGMHVRNAVLEWVKRGNTILVMKETDKFCEKFLQAKEIVEYRGSRVIGTNWYGGNYLVKEHELFEGLPTNKAFNWEYQCLADYKKQRYGLRIGNGETVVAVSADHKPEMYSSVVVVPLGKGKIILSTLDLEKAVLGKAGNTIVAKKILQNYLKFAQKTVSFQE